MRVWHCDKALIVTELLECGFLARHVSRLNSVLGANVESMCKAIDAHIPGAVYEKPLGGYFLFLKLPQACRIDAPSLLEQTSADPSIPITFTVGDACVAASDTQPAEFRRFLRLSFAFHTAEEIMMGVALLGRHIAQHM
jgi:DNA-binding transcriptional MocR family regulator